MKKFWQLAAAATLALTVLTACSNESEPSDNQPASDFKVTATDAIGKEITLLEKPDRIVSLTPSNTEILFGLGLEEEIVGVNDIDNYPEQVATKQRIGSMEYNLEAIIALEPDIVFAHESSLGGLEVGIPQLEAAGLNVFVVDDANTFEETYETMEKIGALTGMDAEADAMIDSIQEKLKEVTTALEGIEKKSAFIVIGAAPEIYVAGQETFMNEMLKVINVENAVKESGWTMYSAEQFVTANPDSLIFTYAEDLEVIKTNAAFSVMDAVTTDALTVVDGDTTSRQGPRLAEGVEELAKAIYPEAFK